MKKKEALDEVFNALTDAVGNGDETVTVSTEALDVIFKPVSKDKAEKQSTMIIASHQGIMEIKKRVKNVRVILRDYDTEGGTTNGVFKTDEDGCEYIESIL